MTLILIPCAAPGVDGDADNWFEVDEDIEVIGRGSSGAEVRMTEETTDVDSSRRRGGPAAAGTGMNLGIL